MSEKDFPKKIDFPKKGHKKPSREIQKLIERGHQIENRIPKWVRERPYFTTIISLLSNMITSTLSIMIAVLILASLAGSPDFIEVFRNLSSWSQSLVLVGSFILVSFIINLILWRITVKIIKKANYMYLNFPRPRYAIFLSSVKLVENLITEDRIKAKNKISTLYDNIEGYLDENRDVKDYIYPEFQKTFELYPLERLIMLSENKRLPYLFLNLGLAFIHENFPRVYLLITELNKEIENFPTKRKGVFRKVLGFFERYSKVLEAILRTLPYIVILIMFLLTGKIFLIPL